MVGISEGSLRVEKICIMKAAGIVQGFHFDVPD
jgi:hypothetical protein